MPFIPPYGCPDQESCRPDDQWLVGEGKEGGRRNFVCGRCNRGVRACPASDSAVVAEGFAQRELAHLRFYRWKHARKAAKKSKVT